jgi:hypothetical protein
MACGRLEDAQKTLDEVALCNKTTLPSGKLKAEPEVSEWTMHKLL